MTMKVIVAGCRGYHNRTHVEMVLDLHLAMGDITEVISGGASGVDRLGEQWARKNKIPVAHFYADWSKGKSAGPKRNSRMAEYGEVLIAFWDGKSRGTRDMIEKAKSRKLKLKICYI